MSNLFLRIGTDKDYVSTLDIGNIEINFSLKDVNNYGGKNSSFTKPITVKRTKESDKVFQGLHNIGIVSSEFDISKKTYAEIVENGITIFKGYLRVTEITPNDYKIILFSIDTTLFTKLGEKWIKGNFSESDDIYFTENLNTHVTDPSVIREYLRRGTPTDGKTIFYPIVDYSDYLSNPETINNLYPIMPAVPVALLFDRIIKQNGFTYTLSEDISTLINKMFIPLNSDEINTNYNYGKYYPYITIDTSLTIAPEYTGSFVYQSKLINSPAYAVPGWNISRRDASVATSIGYDYYVGCPSSYYQEGLKLPIGNITLDVSLTMVCSSINRSVDVNLYKYNFNGTIDEYKLGTVNADISVGGLSYLNKSISIENQQEAKLWLSTVPTDNEYAKSTTYKSRVVVYPYLLLNPNSTIKLTLNKTYFDKKSVDINDLLPRKYKQKDFINDILTMTNSYVNVSNDSLDIKSYTEYYRNFNIKNWSSKIDSDSIYFESVKNNFPASIKLTYSDDGEKYNGDFKSKFDVNFGTGIINNDSEFATGETVIQISSPTAAEKELNKSYEPTPPDVFSFIFNDVSIKEIDNKYSIRIENSTGYINLNRPYGDTLPEEEIRVICNDRWTAYPLSWVSISPNTFIGESFLKIVVSPNGRTYNNYPARSGWVYFKNNQNQIVGQILFSQVARYYSGGGSTQSDINLKTNISSFNAMDIINKIEPKKYNWNSKAEAFKNEQVTHYGVIAQDIEKILPDIVDSREEFKRVDYIQLIPILIQAIKEQQVEINNLKNHLNII